MTEPVRVQQDGSWTPTDLTLQSVDGTVKPVATAVPVQFSAGGSGALAQIKSASGQWLSESWKLGSLPTPTLDGSSATYADVLPDVDLKLTATATGMAEVLVVKNAAAAANPDLASIKFGVDNGSLTTTSNASGSAVATAADGSTQLVAGAATWWDSSAPGSNSDGPGGLANPVPAQSTVTDSSVTVNAAAPATKPGVTYPVYVDPDWTGTPLGWAYVDSAYPNQSYWEDPDPSDNHSQHVGYIDGAHSYDDHVAHTTRSFWQMSTTGVKSAVIKNAVFKVTNVYSFSCSPRAVTLDTAGVVSPGSTWNNQPGLAVFSDTQSFAYGYSSDCPYTGLDAHFSATAAVKRAAAANDDAINFALIATDESDIYGWKKFSGQAQLVITYYKVPTTPSFRSVAPCWAVCGSGAVTRDSTPRLGALSATADHAALRYNYQVCAAGGSVDTSCASKVAFSDPNAYADGSPSSVSVTAVRPDGNYEYQVQACRDDQRDVCSDWTSPLPYTIKSSFYPASFTAAQKVPPTVTPPADLYMKSAPSDSAPAPTHHEFVKASFGFSLPTVSGIYGFAYSDQPGTFALPASFAGCPSTSGTHITLVCANSSHTASGTVVPINLTSGITVIAFDGAGNGSNGYTGYYDCHETLANEATHAWLMPPTSAPTDPFPDRQHQSTGPQLSWNGNGVTLQSVSGDHFVERHDAALSFPGSAAGVAQTTGSTAPVTVDANHNMTVAVWVKPNSVAYGQTLVSQASTFAAFRLGISTDGKWMMCMPSSTTTATPYDCATGGSAQANAWTLVIGEWISSLNQLAIYSYAYSSDGQTVSPQVESAGTADHATVAAASNSPLQLSCTTYSGTSQNCFTGFLSDPFVYADALDKVQRGALYSATPTDLLQGSNS